MQPPRFHLAFHANNVDEYRLSKARNGVVIRVALVPADLPRTVDLWRLQTITLSGEPGPEQQVSPYNLLSLRRADTTEGTEDLAVEGAILRRLKERALARGHVLPEIVLTTRMPHWSKMPVPNDLLNELRRAAEG